MKSSTKQAPTFFGLRKMRPKIWYMVNKMLIEPEWLNMLVDSGETKGYVIQADQVYSANAYVVTVDETESYLFHSWTKKDMILKPPSDRGQKVTSPILLAALQRCKCPLKG
jgi:hypothetical protein